MGAIYFCGVTGLYLNLNYVMGKDISLLGALKIGVLPFLAADTLKAAAATILAYRIVPQLKTIEPRVGLETKR
ncbi:MAG: biotin transporter BioY [Acetomicrobium sp.]